jgi:hypothetical protein
MYRAIDYVPLLGLLRHDHGQRPIAIRPIEAATTGAQRSVRLGGVPSIQRRGARGESGSGGGDVLRIRRKTSG